MIYSVEDDAAIAGVIRRHLEGCKLPQNTA